MGILPDAYISKHEVFKVDVQLLPPAVCLQYKIFKIFCVYIMAQRPNCRIYCPRKPVTCSLGSAGTADNIL